MPFGFWFYGLMYLIYIYIYIYIYIRGMRGAVGRGTAGRSRVRFPMLSLEFFIDVTFPASMALGSIHPENSLGGEGSRCIGLITVPHLNADSLEIWKSHPPGNLRA